MRLDKFLFFTRLTKTRVQAQDVISDGHVRIDGRPVTSSHPSIGVGQVITLPLNSRIRVIRIDALPHRRGPAEEALACYTDLSPKTDSS